MRIIYLVLITIFCQDAFCQSDNRMPLYHLRADSLHFILRVDTVNGVKEIVEIHPDSLFNKYDELNTVATFAFDTNTYILSLSLTSPNAGETILRTLDLSHLKDSLSSANQNLVYDFDSLNISGGTGLPYSLIKYPLSFEVEAQEGKAFDILDKILVAGDGYTLSKTAGFSVTDDHSIGLFLFDQDSTNELQTLIVDGDSLEISGGNKVKIPDDADANPTNEIQTLSIDSAIVGGKRKMSFTISSGNTVYWFDSIGSGGGAGIDTLTDYDALRSYAGSSNVVYVQDFNVIYLGDVFQTLGGVFVKGGSGENGATIIDGWVRVFDNVHFIPDWYEMNGYDDSGTDNSITSANDRTNATIRLANGSGGGVVVETGGVKVFNVGGVDGSIRYGVNMLSNVILDLNGSTYRIDSALIDGSWDYKIIYCNNISNYEIHNGILDGNTTEQDYSTYAQGGKTTGLYFHAALADRSRNIIISDIEINNVFGNALDAKGNASVYDSLYTNFTVKNLRCFRYGEGPQWLNVNNLNISNIYLDPDTTAVGDHFELVRCDGFNVSDFTCVGGSGSGSGIDLYGSRNGFINNCRIQLVKDVIELHKDSYTNYCENITIQNVFAKNRLETTPAAFPFTTGHAGTRNITFRNIYLKNYYQGFQFSDADPIPGPIIIDGFYIDSMDHHAINASTVQELIVKNGTITRCGSHGVFWNSQINPTVLTGEAKFDVSNVSINNSGDNGVRIDMANGMKTYSLKAVIDVDSYDNTDENILYSYALGDTNRIQINNKQSILRTSVAGNGFAVSGITDVFPTNTTQTMSSALDGQRIRLHGRAGGVEIDASANNFGIVLLDSASNVILDSLEWLDVQFRYEDLRWYETDRSDKTAIVDVHGKFVPATEWSGLTSGRVPYWNGLNFVDDSDLTFDGSNLTSESMELIDSLLFKDGAGNTKGYLVQSGNYMMYRSHTSNAGHLFYDHNNSLIMQMDNPDKEVHFYGPLTVRNNMKDVTLSTGSTNDVWTQTGSGPRWLAPASGGGGSGNVTATGIANRVAYFFDSDSLIHDSDLTYNGYDLTSGAFSAIDSFSFYSGATWAGGMYRSGWDLKYKSVSSSGFQLWYDHNNDLMFHLYNNTGDARFYNKLGIQGTALYPLDVFSGDVRFSGHLGLDGKNPNSSYSIYASGHVFLEGGGGNYSYIRNDGYLQLGKSSQYIKMYIDGSDFLFQHQGINTMRLESDNDVRIYDDMYIDGRLSVNTTPSTTPLRVRSEGNDETTSAVYVDASDATKLIELRNDGYMEGAFIEKQVYNTVAGLVPTSQALFGTFTANPNTNNALYDATNRFTVTASGVATSDYFYWFDNENVINGCNISANDTAEINIDLTAKGTIGVNGLTYTQGEIYVYTYSGHELSANTFGRYKDKDNNWASLTYSGRVFEPDQTIESTASVNLYKFTIPSDNYMTDIELNLVNDNGFDLRLLNIQWFPYRTEGAVQSPFVSKYDDQDFHQKLQFLDSDGDTTLVIDGDATNVIETKGAIQFGHRVKDINGNNPSSHETFWGDTATIGRVLKRTAFDVNNYIKIRNNTSTLNNLNPASGAQDITDLGTEDHQRGFYDFSFASGNVEIPVTGTYRCESTISIASTTTAVELSFQFYEDGVAVGSPVFVDMGAGENRTVNMNEVFEFDLGDDIDIRSTRISGTGSVTIGGTNYANWTVTLLHR